MLKRLYVNNFRCLVGFEITFGPMAVFCGANGAGKSSVFDAIRLTRDLACGNVFLGSNKNISGQNISKLDIPCWIDGKIQTFELELDISNKNFIYRLQIEQDQTGDIRIIEEKAICNGEIFLNRDLEGIIFSNQPKFPLDCHQTALSSIQTMGQSKLAMLQIEIEKILIIRPNIYNMEISSASENQLLNAGATNILSWYRYLAQNQEYMDVLRSSLQAVWPDFKYLILEDAGPAYKVLRLRFEGADVYFSSLSDGEKSLLSLYMIHAALATNKVIIIIIDEPDNYISIQELQPWLLNMSEAIYSISQVILISHNSEILDSNPGSNYYFWRDRHDSPSRVGIMKNEGSLSIHEALARGWVALDA
jgi:predicted ATPase